MGICQRNCSFTTANQKYHLKIFENLTFTSLSFDKSVPRLQIGVESGAKTALWKQMLMFLSELITLLNIIIYKYRLFLQLYETNTNFCWFFAVDGAEILYLFINSLCNVYLKQIQTLQKLVFFYSFFFLWGFKVLTRLS